MTSGHERTDLTLDQVQALRTAAVRLQRDFDGVFGAETIDRFLHTSYDAFAGPIQAVRTWTSPSPR